MSKNEYGCENIMKEDVQASILCSNISYRTFKCFLWNVQMLVCLFVFFFLNLVFIFLKLNLVGS